MATSTNSLALISDLVEDVQQEQTLFERKANTVVAAVGAIATTILGMGAYWLESGTPIPPWLPMVIFVAGMVATTLKVSNTKNGVTASVATKLQDGLATKIDLNHIHAPDLDVVPEPPTEQQFAVDKALDLRAEAHALVDYHKDNE